MAEDTTIARPWRRFEPKSRIPYKQTVVPRGHTGESDLDRRIDRGYRRNEAERYRSYLSSFSPERIEAMLRKIDPEGKMKYGMRFVTRMLMEPDGVRALERFTNRALAVMDVENGLDISQDFTREQRDMLFDDKENWQPVSQRIEALQQKMAERPGMNGSAVSRRMAMIGGATAAAGLFAEGATSATSHAAGVKRAQAPEEPEGMKRLVQQMQERMDVLESYVLMVIGAHYGHDVMVEGGRIRDEEVERRVKQVEDVVYDLAQLSRAERPRSAAERYRGVMR
jgi:hypothetical protein